MSGGRRSCCSGCLLKGFKATTRYYITTNLASVNPVSMGECELRRSFIIYPDAVEYRGKLLDQVFSGEQPFLLAKSALLFGATFAPKFHW